jgi:hypothetical protein
MKQKKYPCYYELDGDIYVKLYKENGEVRAINHYGLPYPSFHAVLNGTQITKEEFLQGVFEINNYNKPQK